MPALLGVWLAVQVGCAVRSRPLVEPEQEGVYHCRHIGFGRIAIDGIADERAWQSAPVMTGFVTAGRRPVAAIGETRVRMLRDNHRMYVFFECESPWFRVAGSQRDDDVWEAEAAELFLAPDGPDEPYFEVCINPDGVIFDSRIVDWRYNVKILHGREWARSFNADIEAAVRHHLNDDGEVVGWDVEMAIPFADLGLSGRPRRGTTWRFNVCRATALQAGGVEFSTWHSTLADFHRPHRFARLRF